MSANDYQLVEQAIRFLDRNARRQPALREIAASVGLSEFHFQRLFQRWAGVSPKRFLQYQTAQEAKRVLQETGDLLDASYSAGLSGPGRLHDLIVNMDAVTPGENKRGGAGLVISWGRAREPVRRLSAGADGARRLRARISPAGDRRRSPRAIARAMGKRAHRARA